ncbi:MAG: hypothetical protein ABIB79_01940 [archaeon]
MNKKGQVTIFIIIAIVIVAGAVLYFTLRGNIGITKIPASLSPVYTSFLSCLEDYTLVGIEVLESQAGYIQLPDFEPGSSYMPFSSQLDFLGSPIPYWYYVSGNNIQKEQVPSKQDMADDLEIYLEDKMRGCIFDSYYDQGFEIDQGEPKAQVVIRDEEVEVSLDMNLNIAKGEDTALVNSHEINVKSDLGKLYDSARKIYRQEQETLFLEEYGVDILRLYAPVDGVEMTCSPLTWNADEVFDNLQEAIEVNTMALKVKGEENDYFNLDIDVEEDVRFLNSRNWASGFEVTPSQGNLLISEPIGNQPGLGILGFCYIPYHFVYNVRYPVLTQVQSGDEVFQFPIAVVLQGNMPREAMSGSAVELDFPEICKYKNTQIEVNTYDTNLNPVDAEIDFECAGVNCKIGKTTGGNLETEFPQCINGYVVANSEGFEEAEYIISTVEEGSVDIILDKLYGLNVDLKLDSKDYDGEAIIHFLSDKNSKTIIYPAEKRVELSEGQYEVQVYVYKNSSLKIAETTTEQCVEVPKGNLGGLFGLTEEKCFDIVMPEQIVSNALAGGGKQAYYILESELESANSIELRAESLETPKSIEQLQDNYILFEENGLDINFK